MVTRSDIGSTTLVVSLAVRPPLQSGARSPAPSRRERPAEATVAARGGGGAMDCLLGRCAGTRSRRTRGLCPAGETQPMNLANDGVAGQSVTEQDCDLARALALEPVLPKLLHSFIRPGHRCLVRQFLRLEAAGLRRIPPRSRRRTPSGKTRTSILSEALTTTSRGHLTEKLHYSLNRAQEFDAPGGPAFQQVSTLSEARPPRPRLDCLSPIKVLAAPRLPSRPHINFSSDASSIDQITALPLYLAGIGGRPSGAAFLFCLGGRPPSQSRDQIGTGSWTA